MKALRHTKTGEIYPMHEHLAKHPDVEFVDLDSKMQVIEPEEVGPAAEPAKPTARKSTRRKPEADTSGDDLSIGDE